MKKRSFLVPLGVALAALTPQANAKEDGEHVGLDAVEAGNGAGRPLFEPLLALPHAGQPAFSPWGHSSHSSHASHASHASHVSHVSHASHVSGSAPTPPSVTRSSPPPASLLTPAGAGIHFTAVLTTDQEVEPTFTTVPTGRLNGVVSGGRLVWTLTMKGLSGRATGADLRVAPRGVDGRRVARLCGPCATRASGVVKITASTLRAMLAGRSYVNVVTAASPKGEIRGQLRRVS